MNCSKCGNTSPITCGCETGIPTPPPCAQGTPACPDPDPCAETFDSQCIIYTGDDIVCDNTTIVETNTNISEALNSIVDYFCDTPAPAECLCLYEAKVTLTKTDITTASTIFAGKASKLVPITVTQEEAIEVVSASYVHAPGQDGYNYLSGNGSVSLQINGLVIDLPQFTDGGAKALESSGAAGIFLMQEYETNPSVLKPNMALGESIYVVVNGVAQSEPTADGTITFNVLYRKVKY